MLTPEFLRAPPPFSTTTENELTSYAPSTFAECSVDHLELAEKKAKKLMTCIGHDLQLPGSP